jgi:hypothetical protein
MRLFPSRARRLRGACTLAALALGSTTRAATVVSYNWLQLKPGQIITTAQGAGTPVSGYGGLESARWGDWLWIPHGNLTASGTADYSITLDLAEPRPVEQVVSTFWTREGTGLSQYHVLGSNDGSSWTLLGTDSTPIPAGQYEYQRSFDVADGVYRYLRLLFKAGEYAYGSASRGGPGVAMFAPVGSGTLADWEVNWSHQASFGTVATSSPTLDFRGNGIHTGDMGLSDGGRVGDAGSWEPGEYARIDLGTVRAVHTAVIDWNDNWIGSAFRIQWSNDGVTFHDVSGMSAPTVYMTDAASMVTFSTMDARYWQIADVTGTGSYHIVQQFMLYGLPEPAAAVLFAAAALAAAGTGRRRR